MITKKKEKECSPLKCKYFSQRAYKFEDKYPVDIFVTKCPFRTHDNLCTNDKESLNENYY